MMNRDSTVIQAAILLIIIAILGVAIVKKQKGPPQNLDSNIQPIVVTYTASGDKYENTQATTGQEIVVSGTDSKSTQPMTEQLNSDKANLVRAYFKALGEQDYAKACDMMSSDKCSSTRESAVQSFSQEYKKFINGYEYLSIKDFGITAPSGKDVVCVKYTYRYIDDLNPQPISEILSFYVDEFDGNLKITDRVCEKKYKEGSGVRPCPIEANANFCIGLIK